MTNATEPGGPRRPIRWWPALAILVAAAVALVVVWTRDAGSTQQKVVPSFPILFSATVLMFLWLVLFARLRGRVRLVIFAVVAVAVGLGMLLLEIKAVDGNLVPILGYRFSAERDFDGSSITAAVRPGPADYPQFYGPGRRASPDAPEPATDWSASPPRELWRRPVGAACSSFAIVGDAAVTQEQRGDEDAVVRYGLRDGEQVWVSSVTAPFNTTVGGSGPRATPTVVDGRVYALGATGILRCLELDSGRQLWRRDLLADHGVGQPDWGLASSPLVVGELVLVQLGNQGTGLAAYDRSTGEPAWRSGDDVGTYTSPLLAEVGAVRQVLVVYRNSVAGHDPLSGAILWRHDWPNPGGERVSMPLVLDHERVLVSAGYGVGSRMLRVTPGADGFDVELLWESRRLKSKFAPMVFHEDVVYGLDDGVLVALDPGTGERLWKHGRYGHGQFIRVGDLLLIQAEDGDLILVEADPQEHRELATLSALSGRTWNPPALSQGLLLLRNDTEAVAYELPVAR